MKSPTNRTVNLFLLTVALILALLCVASVAQARDYAALYQGLPTKVKPVEPFTIPDREVSLTDFGAKGDGLTLCTEAFHKAISHLTAQGGGRLIIPMGVWLSGPIELKDNIELRLDKNALLCFSPDKSIYPDTLSGGWRCLPQIRANGCRNIAITGEGIIDGNGQHWRPVKRGKVSDVEWKRFKALGGVERQEGALFYPWDSKAGYPNIAPTAEQQESKRADMLRLTNCENIRLEGVTFQNSPHFHVHPVCCRNLIISGITVRCPWNAQNGDAIDLSDCHQALVEGCTVDAGDDGLCLKSGNPREGALAHGCKDILMQDNTVFRAHGGFVVGSEFVGGLERVAVRRCRFSGTDAGLRFKSGVGRGGQSSQVYISDIMMNDINGAAVVFQCNYVNRPAGGNVETPAAELKNVPHFTDIHISNVVCRGAHTAISAHGLENLQCVEGIDISQSTFVYAAQGLDIDPETTDIRLKDVVVEQEHK